MKKTLIILLAVGIFIFCIIFAYGKFSSTGNKGDKSVVATLDNLSEQMLKNRKITTSSNPYDYVKDNAYFDSIVSMGYKALPVIVDKIEKSPENGLQEYILAAA